MHDVRSSVRPDRRADEGLRVLLVTAGAGGMYCGSCLRDNTLAGALRARGVDALLVPVYTPTRTDEPNQSTGQVLFGGLSVYLQHHMAFFRYTPWLLDRLWDHPAVIRFFAGRSVQTDPRMLGALTVSTLQGEHGVLRKEIRKLVHGLRQLPQPHVINLPNSLLIGLAAPLARELGVPICCTLQGEDLFLDGLPEPSRSEALRLISAQVQHVDRFLAVSEYYAGFMGRFLGIPDAKIDTVPLGVNLDAYPVRASAVPSDRPFTVGYFARIAPEKGLDRLCAAYRLLRQELKLPAARLEVAGYLGPEHRGYLERLQRDMRAWGLGDEITYRGALDQAQKVEFLHSVDVLSVPSPYQEPKGLFMLEAMACGVPVVQPAHGAYPETIERTGGGVLVPPGDDRALAEALLALATNPSRRAELGRQARLGVEAHYAAGRMADLALAVYARVARRSPAPAPRT